MQQYNLSPKVRFRFWPESQTLIVESEEKRGL